MKPLVLVIGTYKSFCFFKKQMGESFDAADYRHVSRAHQLEGVPRDVYVGFLHDSKKLADAVDIYETLNRLDYKVYFA